MCPECGTGMDEIRDKAIEALRGLWPELRTIAAATVQPGPDGSVVH